MDYTISANFSDEDLCNQIRLQFDLEEMWDMDFKTIFSQIEDVEDYFQFRLRGRLFYIDKDTGVVFEEMVNDD